MYFSRIQLRPDIQRSSQLRHVLATNSYGLHQLLWDLFPEEKKRVFLFREEIAKEQLRNKRSVKGESIFYLVSSQEPSCDTPIFQVESKKYAPVLNMGRQLAFKLRANPVVARKIAGKKHSVRHDVVMDAQRFLYKTLYSHLGVAFDPQAQKRDMRRQVLGSWQASSNDSVEKFLRESIEANERFEELHNLQMSKEKLLTTALKASTDSALEKWLVEKGKHNGFELVRARKWGVREPLIFQAESYRWHAMPKKGRSAGFSTVDFEGELKVTDSELFKTMLFNGVGPAKAFGCGLMLVRPI